MVEGKEIAIDIQAVAETKNRAGRDTRSLTDMTTDAADSDIRAFFWLYHGFVGWVLSTFQLFFPLFAWVRNRLLIFGHYPDKRFDMGKTSRVGLTFSIRRLDLSQFTICSDLRHFTLSAGHNGSPDQGMLWKITILRGGATNRRDTATMGERCIPHGQFHFFFDLVF